MAHPHILRLRHKRGLLEHPSFVVVAALLIAFLGGVTANAMVAPVGTDPGICNRNVAGTGSVKFTVNSGKAVWDFIPHLGISPELDTVSGPVTVVIFDGPHGAVPVFPPIQEGSQTMAPFVFDDVVCVVIPTGEEFYYYNVNTDGMELDGLNVDRIAS